MKNKKLWTFILVAVSITLIAAAPVIQAQRISTIYTKLIRMVGSNGIQMEGNSLILDTDRDSTITVDTDDQIDFEVGSSDVAKITTSGLTVNSGGLTITAGALILGQQSETVTATWVLTPTAPFVVLTSTAEFTSSTTTAIITTTATAGQQLILLNGNASDVLNLDGVGGTVECKADSAMGAASRPGA